MTTANPEPRVMPRAGDVVITVILLAVFVGAYLGAQQWPFKAAFFPQLLAAAGVVFAVLKLAGFGVDVVRARRDRAFAGTADPAPSTAVAAPNDTAASAAATTTDASAADATRPSQDRLISEEEEDDQSLEYVFGTASRGDWAAALGWALGFFVLLWVVGVFIAVPLFALLYLRIAGQASWFGAAIYAAVTGGVLWLVFHQLLMTPMPAGMF